MRIVMMINYRRFWLLGTLVVIIIAGVLINRVIQSRPQEFNQQRAYADVKYQVDLGPRTMGSVAHEWVALWIISNLEASHWQVERQETKVNGQNIQNIIAKRGTGAPWVIIGSHYDSRSVADQDPNPNLRSHPVPGADDGASTVAILLELARVIPRNLDKQVWLVFFDDEDNGASDGSGWSVGANYFVSQLQSKPDSVVILDMLGDKDLKVYMEENSDREINAQIWEAAGQLGYGQFIPMYKHSIIDDHIPFLDAGIRAVDLIDIEYPYWHTTQDTLDKIFADSLKVAGDTVLKWLEEYP